MNLSVVLFLERINCHCPRFSSVQFSHSVISDSLQPHRLRFVRLPYPSPTPRACSNSCASSRWCHTTISSSVIPFSSCLQSFPASGSFPMSQEKILAPGYGDKITWPCDFFFFNLQRWAVLIHNKTIVSFTSNFCFITFHIVHSWNV